MLIPLFRSSPLRVPSVLQLTTLEQLRYWHTAKVYADIFKVVYHASRFHDHIPKWHSGVLLPSRLPPMWAASNK